MVEVERKIEGHRLCIRDCGVAEYRGVLELQYDLQEKRQRGEIPNTVLIVEHTPTITLGARKSANKLLAEVETIKESDIDIVEIRRGGGTTAHNPGQLVFYPIMNLAELNLGISEYVRMLEEIGMELLGQLGIEAGREKGYPGLWIGKKKIASVGVRVSKQITYHGMAINIKNDLGIFDLLVPCGLDAVEMTSVKRETKKDHSMADVKKRLSVLLVKHFSSEGLVEYEECG